MTTAIEEAFTKMNYTSLSDSLLSHGSTTAGDSFVLPLDWHQEYVQDDNGIALFEDNPMQLSFDDPYLPPITRKVSFQQQPNPSIPHSAYTKIENNNKPSHKNLQQGRIRPVGSLTGNYTETSFTDLSRSPIKSTKSLGTFDLLFSDDGCGVISDSSDINYVVITGDHIPKNFEPVNDDSGIVGTVSTADEEDQWCSSRSDSRHSQGNGDVMWENEEIERNQNGSHNLAPKTTREKVLDMIVYYKSQLGPVYDEGISNFSEHSRGNDNNYVHSKVSGVGATECLGRFERAGLWMDLGLSEILAHQFESAVQSFLQAACVYRDIGRAVATARALDRAGVAYCRALKQYSSDARKLGSNESITDTPSYCVPAGMKASGAMQCLRDSLTIRQNELGPWHIDTVDTLNHMANLYFLTGNAAQSAIIGEQVFYLRHAIFGPLHPAVGVVAHEVANATLQANSMSSNQARHWYQLASDIYKALNLSIQNPAVQNLLKDIRRMERIDLWREQSNEDQYMI